jgi:hypothetical protein
MFILFPIRLDLLFQPLIMKETNERLRNQSEDRKHMAWRERELRRIASGLDELPEEPKPQEELDPHEAFMERERKRLGLTDVHSPIS